MDDSVWRARGSLLTASGSFVVNGCGDAALSPIWGHCGKQKSSLGECVNHSVSILSA